MKPFALILSMSLAALALSGGVWAAENPALDPAKIEAAKTPADHEAIAKAYEEEAASLDKTAEMHKNLSETYGTAGLKATQAAQSKHCASVAADLKRAAHEERALAAAHHKMAKEAGR
jgi:hypothetical protein